MNLRALACRSEKNFVGDQKITMTESSLPTTSMAATSSLPKNINGSLSEKDYPLNEFKENIPGSNPGPLTPSSTELNSNWGVFGKVCRLDKPFLVDEVHLRRFDGLLVTN